MSNAPSLSRYHRRFGVRWALCGLIALCLGVFVQRASAQSADEVAAAFLFNFAKFVEWPSAAFTDANAPVTIGFVGKPGLADTFEQKVKGKNANSREFSVKRLTGSAGAEGCQIVFVGDASQIGAVVSAVKGKPILTVGEGEPFLSTGGMISFSRDGARLIFDVNADAIKSAALKADPKLEKAAHSVKRS